MVRSQVFMDCGPFTLAVDHWLREMGAIIKQTKFQDSRTLSATHEPKSMLQVNGQWYVVILSVITHIRAHEHYHYDYRSHNQYRYRDRHHQHWHQHRLTI